LELKGERTTKKYNQKGACKVVVKLKSKARRVWKTILFLPIENWLPLKTRKGERGHSALINRIAKR